MSRRCECACAYGSVLTNRFSRENLKSAIVGETHGMILQVCVWQLPHLTHTRTRAEYTQMYPGMARTAREEVRLSLTVATVMLHLIDNRPVRNTGVRSGVDVCMPVTDRGCVDN